MKLLIGNTGLIGTTLKKGIQFDYEFNSSNLKDLLNININPENTDIYLCCLPATKWKINQDLNSDFQNILNILDIITKKEYRNVILYSTIDVYQDAPENSDESYVPNISTLSYGNNRYIFENLIKTTVKYKNLTILRLPALFGDNIKKNILFDLLNNNEIDKINFNSSYQWYDLDELVKDTQHCVDVTKKYFLVNLFPEPINTKDILALFNKTKSDVNSKLKPINYNFRTNTNPTRYVGEKQIILEKIKNFKNRYLLQNTKMAVCLFGEERNILENIKEWKKFSSKVNADFFIALYSNSNIYDTIKILKENLPVKAFYIVDNDLSYFDKLKYKATSPIYIYGVDSKALFSRITSQMFIRQKAVSLVNPNDYMVTLLCRTDSCKFSISSQDIHSSNTNPDIIIVNSDSHVHPGGGGGCMNCTIDHKCNDEYHNNDICDLWCMGSSKVMNKWSKAYDNLLPTYGLIQSKSIPLEQIEQVSKIKYNIDNDNNEIIFKFDPEQLIQIENTIHCFYPEKLLRVIFKDEKILNASLKNYNLWD